MIAAPNTLIPEPKKAAKTATKSRKRSAPIVISEWLAQKEIAELAFEFWRHRRFRNGSPEEDLLRAHREVWARTGRKKIYVGGLFLCGSPDSERIAQSAMTGNILSFSRSVKSEWR